MRFLVAFLMTSAAAMAADCDALAKLALADTKITEAHAVAAGPYTAPGARQAIPNLPAFCQVHGVIRPTEASAIHFEVWLPENWNGRMHVAGNGGLAGSISDPAMAGALRNGYAAASTDTGHTAQEPRTWLTNRDRLIDYSYRGLHLTTLNAKAIVDAYYGKKAAYAYYSGCSYGGKQGLTEAQRFPADFDAIVAGDAANFWTHQMASEVWNGVVTGAAETNLSPEKLQLVETAALAACDALDGIADGLVSDPTRCRFDPRKLLCKGEDGPACLTAAQVGAVEKIYSGPVNPRTREKLYAGLYPGGELGWGRAGGQMVINRTATSGVSSNDFFRFALFNNPDWAFRNFDFDRDLKTADEKLGPVMNATDPNLDEFRKLGHKLVYYHGASDPLVPAQNGIDYFESVVARDKGIAKTQEYFRVFLVPGLYHCSGGPGAGTFAQPDDLVSVAARWAEKGSAPEKIVGTKYVENTPSKGIALQRPHCLYPLVTRYKGSGDPNDAANFICAK
jgi:feruloyl esterase